MHLILGLLRCSLVFDTGLEPLWAIDMEMSTRQVNRLTWSSEKKCVPEIYTSMYCCYDLHFYQSMEWIDNLTPREDMTLTMENIRGRHNKTKDRTWRTTTLKRQKEPPGNDWEGTFSKAGWKHEERGNQRHYQIPKGPETFLTLDWQPPTSYISNLTSFFLPILTTPESLYPCFWPQHANLTIVIHPFLGECDFDILHLIWFYNTWQGSTTRQSRPTEKIWALLPQRQLYTNSPGGGKEGAGGERMVFQEEIRPHRSNKALVGGAYAYGQKLMNGIY